MSSSSLRIGTRGSALALRQAALAVDALRRARQDVAFEIVEISTKGDRDKERPLSELGPKGIFARELQHALASGDIDVAVHSLKDLTGTEPEGLVVAAVLEREDPRDVLVSRDGSTLNTLPPGAVVGTSSVRRQALLAELRPDLQTAPLRGNVDTRLRKVRDGEVDAAILAAAGIIRLERTSDITEWLDPVAFVPSPGQGAIAIEATDERMRGDLAWIAGADHEATHACVEAERTFMRIVEGSCEVPLGAWARFEGDEIVIDAFIVRDTLVRGTARGKQAERVGAFLAEELV